MRCNSAELTGRFQPESSVLFVSCSAGIEPSLIQQVSVACGAYCAFFSNLRGQFVAGVLEGKNFSCPATISHPAISSFTLCILSVRRFPFRRARSRGVPASAPAAPRSCNIRRARRVHLREACIPPRCPSNRRQPPCT